MLRNDMMMKAYKIIALHFNASRYWGRLFYFSGLYFWVYIEKWEKTYLDKLYNGKKRLIDDLSFIKEKKKNHAKKRDEKQFVEPKGEKNVMKKILYCKKTRRRKKNMK